MLTFIRQLLDNWIVRIFFGLLVVVFVFWGISNVVTMIGSSDAVATVAGQPISLTSVENTYQNTINRIAQQQGGKPLSAEERQLIAGGIVGEAIDKAAMAHEVARLGVAAPPDALRRQVFAMSVFQGQNGKFDMSRFKQVLADNNLTPAMFMADMTQSINADQVVQAISAGANAPEPLIALLYNYLGQTRQVAYVQLPFAAAPPPTPPSTPVLRRFWRNHPENYSTPERRVFQAAILSAALLASHETVSAVQIKTYYTAHKSEFAATARRTVEIITAENKGSAHAIATQWRSGASWTQMKAAAKKVSATTLTLKNTTAEDLPSGRLAKAVFAAKAGDVVGPVAGAIGTYVFKVTADTGSGVKPLSVVADKIKARLQLRKAKARVDADLPKLEDALAANTPLDALPSNLGTVTVTATADATGIGSDGKPVTIPGPVALRKAVLKAAFTTPPDVRPQAKSASGNAYFAIAVDKIIKPHLKPYNTVKSAVLSDWTNHQIERQQETTAARLLTLIKSGSSIVRAAGTAGYAVRTTGLISRNPPGTNGIPTKALPILFGLKIGEPTMVETKEGFIVATVTKIVNPAPDADPDTRQRLTSALGEVMQTAALQSFASGLRDRYHVKINPTVLHRLGS